MDASDLPTDLIHTTEAAKLCRCHTATVWRWILRGRIRGWRRAGRCYVSRAELEGMYERVLSYAERPQPESSRERKAREKWTDDVLRKVGVRR